MHYLFDGVQEKQNIIAFRKILAAPNASMEKTRLNFISSTPSRVNFKARFETCWNSLHCKTDCSRHKKKKKKDLVDPKVTKPFDPGKCEISCCKITTETLWLWDHETEPVWLHQKRVRSTENLKTSHPLILLPTPSLLKKRSNSDPSNCSAVMGITGDRWIGKSLRPSSAPTDQWASPLNLESWTHISSKCR